MISAIFGLIGVFTGGLISGFFQWLFICNNKKESRREERKACYMSLINTIEYSLKIVENTYEAVFHDIDHGNDSEVSKIKSRKSEYNEILDKISGDILKVEILGSKSLINKIDKFRKIYNGFVNKTEAKSKKETKNIYDERMSKLRNLETDIKIIIRKDLGVDEI